MSRSNKKAAALLRQFQAAVADVVSSHDLEALEIAIDIGRLFARATSETEAKNPGDLSAADMDVLVALAAQGKPYRAKPTDLAAWARISNAAITGRVDRLTKRNMVSRAIDIQDRRIRWIMLTPVGFRFLRKETARIRDRPLFAAIQQLSAKERKTLLVVLRKLA